MAGTPKITIDRDLCMGSGMCVHFAGATFAHDDEAKAYVVDPEGDPMEQLLLAEEACPTGALKISVED
jgi:ferredoxin